MSARSSGKEAQHRTTSVCNSGVGAEFVHYVQLFWSLGSEAAVGMLSCHLVTLQGPVHLMSFLKWCADHLRNTATEHECVIKP